MHFAQKSTTSLAGSSGHRAVLNRSSLASQDPARMASWRASSFSVPVQAPSPSTPSTISIKSSKFSKGIYTVQGILDSPTPSEVAYNVLLDIGNSHNVYRNISDSNVWFTDEGDKRLTEHCGWNFLVFAGTFPVVLDVQEDRFHRQLEFNMVECNFMKHMQGRWEVFEKEGGGCIIDHTLSVKPVVVPPAMIGSFTKRIFAKQVMQILEDLQAEIQRKI